MKTLVFVVFCFCATTAYGQYPVQYQYQHQSVQQQFAPPMAPPMVNVPPIQRQPDFLHHHYHFNTPQQNCLPIQQPIQQPCWPIQQPCLPQTQYYWQQPVYYYQTPQRSCVPWLFGW